MADIRKNSPLTTERLKELLSYSPETGLFVWLKNRCSVAMAGDVAGTPINGYLTIVIDKLPYRAHRLAWFYMTGKWPFDKIDHINGVRNDNKWVNLREADNHLNMQNIRKAICKVGYLGVTIGGRSKRYQARIRVDGKTVYLGTFDSPQEAHTAYVSAKRKHHPGCTI